MSSPTAALHPRYAEIVDYLTRARADVELYVNGLSEPARQARATPDRWSVMETLEHLSLVEDSIGRVVSHLAKQANADGALQDDDVSSVLTCLDTFGLNTANAKLVAPERVRPAGVKSVQESLQNLRISRERLLAAIQAANGLDLTRVSAPHPLLGPMNGYQWLVLIATHEYRHLKQMKEAVSGCPDTAS